MAAIDDYARDIQRALIDAAQDDVFRNFIDPSDLETVVIDLGDGTQAQVQALKRSSVREVLQRLIAAAKQAGVDLKHWICSADEFDLCRKVANSFPGAVMRELHDFLRNRWTQATTVALGAVAAFAQIAAVLTAGKFLAILAAIGFVNKEFLALHCRRRRSRCVLGAGTCPVCHPSISRRCVSEYRRLAASSRSTTHSARQVDIQGPPSPCSSRSSLPHWPSQQSSRSWS